MSMMRYKKEKDFKPVSENIKMRNFCEIVILTLPDGKLLLKIRERKE